MQELSQCQLVIHDKLVHRILSQYNFTSPSDGQGNEEQFSCLLATEKIFV